MYLLTYDPVNCSEENRKNVEGVGAIYQRVVSLMAISKKIGIPYLHQKFNIGHNDVGIDNNLYDDLWYNYFNIKVKELTEKEKKEYKPIYIYVLTPQITNKLIENKNKKFLVYIKNPYLIINMNPNIFYSEIQDEICLLYNEANKNRPLIYKKDKINIAIHIRVFNNLDDKCEKNNYNTANNTARFYLKYDFYINLIENLKKKYDNSEIHIFSQEEYFDTMFKQIKEIEDINLHLTMDNFTTFHHLAKADVLVLGLSSFSHLAGLYNKKEVYYIYYEYHKKALNKWFQIYFDK